MVRHCFVPGCKIRGRGFKFFSVPYTTRDRWEAWLAACPFLKRYSQAQLENVRICILHFDSQSMNDKFKLNRNAVPKLNLPKTSSDIQMQCNSQLYLSVNTIQSGKDPEIAVTCTLPLNSEVTLVGENITQPSISALRDTVSHSTGTDVPDKESSDGACPKEQDVMKKLQDVDDRMEYIGVEEKLCSRQDNQAVRSNNLKDVPIKLGECIDPSCLDPEFDEPPKEAIFSWQKEEILYPTDDTDVLMAMTRSDQLQELDDLSLYNDDGTHKEAEYQCNVCEEKIMGLHYTCVQCADYDLCGACEANGAHNSHYVLRVPKDRPYNEIQTVLAAIREQLLAEKLFLTEQIIENDVKSEPEEGLGGPTPDPAPEASLPTRSDDEYSDGSEYKPSRRKRRRRSFDINNDNSASDSDSDSNSDSSAVTTLSARKPHDQHKAKNKPETRSALIHPVHGSQVVTGPTDRQPVDVFENTHEKELTSVELTSISQTHDSYSTRKSLTATSIFPIQTKDLNHLESLNSTSPPINQLDNQTEQNNLLELPGTIYEVTGDIEDLDVILEVPDDVTVVVQETPPTPLVTNVIDSGKNVCDVRKDGGEVLRVPPDTNDESQALHSKVSVALQPLVIQWAIADR